MTGSGVHFETGTISQTPYVMAEDVDKSSLPRGYVVIVNTKFQKLIKNLQSIGTNP